LEITKLYGFKVKVNMVINVTQVSEIKGVGRKISRRGANKKRPKISTIKPLPEGGGATEEKTENIKKE